MISCVFIAESDHVEILHKHSLSAMVYGALFDWHGGKVRSQQVGLKGGFVTRLKANLNAPVGAAGIVLQVLGGKFSQ